MRIPYVIDNREKDRSLRHVLRGLLAEHEGKSVDVATAFFSVRGFAEIAEGLDGLGSLRILLGSEPASGLDIGLHPDPEASRIDLGNLQCDPLDAEADAEILRRELERSPLDEERQKIVEKLIRLLRKDSVEIRRYNKGFLHAKTWLFYADRTKRGQRILWDRLQPLLGIVGSSNFTYPGLTGNNELNLCHQVIMDEYMAEDDEAAGMVAYLDQEKASPLITPRNRQLVKSEVGARAIQELVDWYDEVWDESIEYKDQFIKVLVESKYGEEEYEPHQIYLKALWHKFRDELGQDLPDRSTAVELTEFQDDAVKRARRIIARYDGVMIADAVGLGKTWIGKRLLEEWGYHQRQRVLVICPASLREMWTQELQSASIAGEIISQEEMGRKEFDPFAHGDADIILIDESHNFRNHTAQRYEALEQLIACNGGRGEAGHRKKLILLTATPINNDVFDLYNQVQLITQGNRGAFASAGIGDLRRYFLAARRSDAETADQNLFNLLEEITVRRPRSTIKEYYPDATIGGNPINWPDRKLHTQRYSLASTYGEDFYKRIVERIENLNLAPYDLESYRIDPGKVDDMQLGRGQALVGIFKSLYLKRFESSVEAFRISIERARNFQKAYLQQLRAGKLLTSKDFRKLQSLRTEGSDQENNDDIEDLLEGLESVSLAEYESDAIEEHVEEDIEMLSEIYGVVSHLQAQQDQKLQQLREMLRGKLNGKKVLIFSYYKDTSRYLYRCLREDDELLEELGDPNLRIADSDILPKDRETIVERFAPRANNVEGIAGTDREIDILLATDVLSEGRNLQDCQYLINYDLHWAPIRLVQRIGRIDRIGTPFDILHVHNFFPEARLDDLLGLVATLTDKIQTIDDQGLHDASVLGETPHPRAFNQIKRVENEDADVIDEEADAVELASAETLRLQLQEALQQQQAKAIEDLPDGIHSAREKQDERGIFFCFETHPDDPHMRQTFWIYWDHEMRRFEDNMYRIAELIACKPDEERKQSAQDVYDILPKAMQYIAESSRRTSAGEDARTETTKEQNLVRVTIRDEALQAGIDRKRVMAVLKFLNQPMFRFAVRRLRETYQEYNADQDIKKLVNEVDDLRLGFEADADEQEEAESSEPITADDLHLACFEYVV